MILKRWSLPSEGFLPFFMMLSTVISGFMLFFVKIEFPTKDTYHARKNIGHKKILLLNKDTPTTNKQLLNGLQFIARYSLTPALPHAEISVNPITRIFTNESVLPSDTSPLVFSYPPTESSTDIFFPSLISLLSSPITSSYPELTRTESGYITFIGTPQPLITNAELPTIATETPLRTSVYRYSLSSSGFLENVLILESSGRTDVDRLGLNFLRKMQFPADAEQPRRTGSARIFWPQAAYNFRTQ